MKDALRSQEKVEKDAGSSKSKVQKSSVDIELIVQKTISDLLTNEVFIKTITTKFNDLVDKKIKELEKTVNTYENRIIKLEYQVDNYLQKEKINNVCIYGIDENKTRNLKESVVNILNEKMLTSLSSDDIEWCNRVGDKKNNKSRPTIIKFKNIESKNYLLKNRKKFKGTPYFVMEDLTYNRIKLLIEAQNKFGKKCVWTYKGQVYAMMEEKIMKLNQLTDISKYNPEEQNEEAME